MSIGRKEIIGSFFWKLLEKSSVQVVSFVVTLILARILTPNDYGMVALIMVLINIADVIIEGGLNTALIQKKGADNLDFSTIFFISIVVSVIFYLVLFVCSPVISSFYHQPELSLIIRILGISLFFYAINSVQRAYVSKHMRFKELFYSSLVSVVISGICGIVLAKKGAGVWALVVYNLLNISVTTFIMWSRLPWRPCASFSFERFKGLFDYGWKIMTANFLTSLFVNIRGLIIGRIYSPSVLAFFERGRQFPTLIMSNINTSIQTILFPVFSESQEDRDRVKDMVRRSIKISCYFIFPLMVGLFVTAKPLIILLLTEKWINAVPYVQIFSIAYLLMPMQIANMEAVKSLGYSGITLKLEIIKKFIEITILIITVFISAYAIAIGVVVYNFICIFINSYPNTSLLNYKISEQLMDITPPFAISLIMGFTIKLIQYISIPILMQLILQILIGSAVYIALSYLWKIDSFNYIVNFIKDDRIK